MISQVTDRLLKPVAKFWRREKAMKRIGIERLRGVAKRYNRWRYADRDRRHRAAFSNGYEAMLRENGTLAAWPPRVQLKDGWAPDDSMTLPHLDRLLEQGREIVRERGGKQHSAAQQPFLRSVLFPGDLEKYPAILDFILSSEVLATASHHLKTVPVLS